MHSANSCVPCLIMGALRRTSIYRYNWAISLCQAKVFSIVIQLLHLWAFHQNPNHPLHSLSQKWPWITQASIAFSYWYWSYSIPCIIFQCPSNSYILDLSIKDKPSCKCQYLSQIMDNVWPIIVINKHPTWKSELLIEELLKFNLDFYT